MKLTITSLLLTLFISSSCWANHLKIITAISVNEQNQQQVSGHLITQVFNATGEKIHNVNLRLVNSSKVQLDNPILQFFTLKDGGVRHISNHFYAQPLDAESPGSILWRINYDDALGHHQEFVSSKINNRL